MAQRAAKKAASGGSEPIWVVDGHGRRPFMRGIMVHALTARGLPFDEAYRIADRVRHRIRRRTEVQRAELGRMVADLLGAEELGDHQPPLPLTADIEVRGSGPFSKGVLSQSLLAASIDPNDAFDVAREIERELVRRRASRISRKALRKLAYERLLERFGERSAQRYLVWRAHQEPDRPVILLLGGTAGVGKTSIALEVATRLGIRRVISTDSIRQIMRIMLSEELVPTLHHSSFDAHTALSPQPASADRVVEGFLLQTATVSVGVRATLDRAIEENTSLVLDGVSLVPGMIDLSEYADAAHVTPLLVSRFDEKAFRGHFRARGREGSRRGQARYLKHFRSILAIQDYLLQQAEAEEVPIVDNLSVESSVLLVMRHLVETLRREVRDPEAALR